ncbi:LysR substrate binding domain-containing protein [Actinokineospora alba]|uniref:LysR substrate binding domain-containing protein n=1 Tax=Actinokineospora alba TaxID=504798 RepID=A0A1H0G6V6_9PSEU|nr:LysR family substrate-binding domain-containing protein [Actinokineospora alba]TDP69788.1 LysR substrate binding domain-containing protein [Actinokineospora alba]SDI08672.1 LysR substrate binding domain-containing protein [Actinokineospora alba]SDO02645.1 LysR substrate binding domain-containing protein [Actinokineospora alba]
MTGPDVPPPFTLAYVPGVIPGKWVRTWNERTPDEPLTLLQVPAADAAAMVRDGGADAVLLRLPIDRTGLHAIPLYTETTVVVVPKDHLVAAADEVSVDDLADSIVLHPLDDTLDWDRPPGLPALDRPATTLDAVELVAAGIGLLVVPQSLARLHHRKDLTYRPLTDATQSQVALSWLEDETTDAIERFIGIVRGRTDNSTRGRQPTATPAKAKRPAAEGRKGAGKQAGTPKRRTSGAAQDKRGKPRRRS